jgi:hypothetical protein
MSLYQNAYLERELLAKTDKSGNCWLWTAGKTSGGYGTKRFEKRNYVVHRLAYELWVGPIPDGLDLDHLCHQRDCLRPDHLRPVTRKQNMENMAGPAARSTSGVRGLAWHSGKWKVQVRHHDVLHYGGRFTDIQEAEQVAIALRNRLYTHNDLDRRDS